MKKLLKRFLAISLTVLTMFTAVACSGGNKEEEEAVETPTYQSSEYDLVKNSVTEYKLVYPEEQKDDSLMIYALNEFSLFFRQATGITITQESDKDMVYSDGMKVISIGETSLLSGANVTVDKTALKETGYMMKRVGQSVFLVGGSIYGTINSVYGFLSAQFDYECYAPDEIALQSGVTDEKLVDVDVVDVPDIVWRIQGTGESMTNTTYTRRMMSNMQSDFMMTFGSTYYHNFFSVVTESERAAHPEWVSNHGLQLCLTTDFDGLVEHVVEKMKAAFLANPNATALSFTQMDDGGWCSCDNCKASKDRYGTDSAAMILFMNECARRIKVWNNEVCPERNIYLYMFAYHSTTDAPAHKDANGNWVANDESLIFEDNLLVQYAPIAAAGYYSYDNDKNKEYNEIMQKWKALTDKFMFWSYNYYYKGQNFHPYYDFHDLRNYYKYLENNGVFYLFEEDRCNVAKWTDWSRLKMYVRTNLSWNNDADLNKLYDDFFKNYYKDAATPMRKLFDEYSAYMTYIINRDGIRGQGGTAELEKAEYWPKSMLDGWMGYIEEAYSTIKYLKGVNQTKYTLLYDRICLDSIPFRFLSEEYNFSSVYVGDGNSLEYDMKRFGLDEIDT